MVKVVCDNDSIGHNEISEVVAADSCVPQDVVSYDRGMVEYPVSKPAKNGVRLTSSASAEASCPGEPKRYAEILVRKE